jgi:hypothetical protein
MYFQRDSKERDSYFKNTCMHIFYVKQLELQCIAHGNLKWYILETDLAISYKIKHILPHDMAILPVAICLSKRNEDIYLNKSPVANCMLSSFIIS